MAVPSSLAPRLGAARAVRKQALREAGHDANVCQNQANERAFDDCNFLFASLAPR